MPKAKQQRVLETASNTYHLEKIIGEGGAGVVWRAADSSSRDVGIKVLAAKRATADRLHALNQFL